VQRPTKPATPPDPAELQVRPDQDGRVRFQFRGQAWPDVLEWFGEIAGMSVDWQELPADYLNIATQRGYRVVEIRDLLNRLLLARGFTMLQQDEFLIVVKCEALSAGLVPRVTPLELDTLSPHDYVRVLFELDWLLAEDAAEELQPLLSKNGKLFPLATTNRIEAMDAVAHLQEIRRVLDDEQSPKDGEPRLVREFVLEYARAQDVKDQLTQLLGQSPPPQMSMAGMTPEQMQQQQQMMQMQMQAQMQAQQQAMQMQGGGPPQPPGRRARRGASPLTPVQEDSVRMVVNARRNSIVVQAPPDKLAIITDAIRLLDVPEPGHPSLQAFLGRMQVYRLAQLDPRKLADSLQELGGLDPTTRLEVDEANRAIIAYASPADHFTIRSTVEKLDSSARRVEVIPLRQLAADEVAGTIQYLMSGRGDASSSPRGSYGYMDFMYGSPFGRRNRQEESRDEFRVDADVANNRLLVRANDVELEEVVDILVKLGEIPRTAAASGLTRVLDVVPGENAPALLEKLQQDWRALSPHPLILPTLPADPPSADAPAAPPPAEPAPAAVGPQAAIHTSLYKTALYQLAADEPVPGAPDDTAAEAPAQPTAEAAPIVLSIGPDGRLVIASRDPEALAEFEEFARRMAPRPRDYQIFRLQNASATWVVLNLEDFFEDKEAQQTRNRDRMMSWYYGMPSASSADSDSRRLSNRRPLKFISDIDTNTILVQGADAEQLRTIKELIELYDVPEPVNSQKARVTRLFTIRYSKASVVASVIKDAYRDLLSANDRALQDARQDKNQPRGGGFGMTVISPFGGGDDAAPPDTRTSARFEGKLSIGVDDVTNTLLVSTEGDSLMSVIAGMVEALDEAAKPVSELRVTRLRRDTDGSRLAEALQKVLGKGGELPPGAPPPPGMPPPGSPPPGLPPGAAPAPGR
jgi:type II secretory pathway component GspD/PulD (secretin)